MLVAVIAVGCVAAAALVLSLMAWWSSPPMVDRSLDSWGAFAGGARRVGRMI